MPLDWRLTAGFRREVLRVTARIPFGRTSSYREVAARAGSPAAFRATGSALATNPLPIVVPCHRVLPSAGGIGQYRGGAAAKALLLRLEGAACSPPRPQRTVRRARSGGATAGTALLRPGSWPVAYDPVGGMQNQVRQSTRELDRAGIRQTVVVTTFIPGCERTCRLFDATALDSVGLHLPILLAPALLNVSWFACMVPTLVARMRAHDVVHVHLNHSIWCRLLAILAKRAGRPLVVTLNVSLLSDGAAGAPCAAARPGLPAAARGPGRCARRTASLHSRSASSTR